MSGVRGVQGRTFRGGVTAALAGCLLLAGCTGGGSPTAPPSTSVSPSATSASPTQTASGSLAPTLPAAAQAGTRAGAEAFFRYFWDVYNYSYKSLDAAALDVVSEPGCKFCVQSRKDLTDAIASNRTFEGGSVMLDLVVVAPVDGRGGALVNAIATQSEGRLVAADGSTVRTFPAQNKIRVDAGVRWEGSRWRLVDVSVVRSKATTGP